MLFVQHYKQYRTIIVIANGVVEEINVGSWNIRNVVILNRE